MQSMHRQVGKLKKRSADDSQVAVLKSDFDEADKLLGRVSPRRLGLKWLPSHRNTVA